ncbi:MAG: 30S ribosomal protein S6, partial [Phycisphaerae bacterium]|nr:30S ribosomal protein S6 [Phycisphaerae bacterium]
MVSLNKWDDRRLCFEIQKRNRGTYILCYFNTLPESLSNIERDVQISEDILRVQILRADRIPQDILDIPTPAMAAEQ